MKNKKKEINLEMNLKLINWNNNRQSKMFKNMKQDLNKLKNK